MIPDLNSKEIRAIADYLSENWGEFERVSARILGAEELKILSDKLGLDGA